jgi:hypothetical protein
VNLSSELNEGWQQPRDENDHDVRDAAMAGMSDLQDMLEWVVDGFDQ